MFARFLNGRPFTSPAVQFSLNISTHATKDEHQCLFSKTKMDRGIETPRKKLATKAPVKFFHCVECPKKYQGKKDLNDHVRVVHQKDPFICITCRQSFQSRSGYIKHRNKKACTPQQQLSFQPGPFNTDDKIRKTPPSDGPPLAPSKSAPFDDDPQPSPQESPTQGSPLRESHPQSFRESASPQRQQSSGSVQKLTNRNHSKGGIKLGAGGVKRHRKILRDSIQGITNSAIRRLARCGGVKRISGSVYEHVRGSLKMFLENVIRDAAIYTEHAQRNIVNTMDIACALKRQGLTIYGFDS